MLSHARALLASKPEGVTEYVEADLRDPERILDAAGAAAGFQPPVAVMLMTILQHVDDEDDPGKIVATLMDADAAGQLSRPLPSGQRHRRRVNGARWPSALTGSGGDRSLLRHPCRGRHVSSTAWNWCAPGMVQASKWRPVNETEAGSPATLWAGVARKKLTRPG